MTTLKEQFVIPKRYNTWSMALMGVGILCLIILFITHGAKSDQREQARFWASLLQNSVYFLLMTNAVMFFICATTLAWGGFQISFRRVSEAISTAVPVIGVISVIIMLVLVFGNNHIIYQWADPNQVKASHVLQTKSPFLNKGFFTVWTLVIVSLWWLIGAKVRNLSRSIDDKSLTVEQGKNFTWTNTVWAAIYLVVFALSVMSTIPWLWLMSIDAHWYSTMYSWYTWVSTFVPGCALIAIFIIYLKNQGYLELTNEEHLHDLGKFMFAFSIFWTYLWFSQYMLIWYSNQPEETTYFIDRLGSRQNPSPYKGIFFLNLVINFVAPILILMKRGSKRHYATMTFMCVLLIFGHWLDFFQMVFPAVMKDPVTGQTHVPFMLFDFGIGLGFVGLIMFLTGRSLSKYPMIIRHHPFIKESIIHHT
ncbi:MAG: quinol:cytochrome C oxidoreductase [Bacteroidetes bacterium]|nr:MAG: quinol:cytochrome C oxidoreductase [Bacteroidota bacterium]